MNFIKELLQAKCIIVLYSIAHGGGATKSIFSYYKYNLEHNQKIVFIIRDTRRGGIKLFLAFIFGKKIIVNGLAAFSFWDMLLFSYFKKSAMFYLHEAKHAVDYFKSMFPLKYKIAKKILEKKPLLCVSQWQADYFKNEYGNKNIKIVYETVDSHKQISLSKEHINIVMVGYFSERKGVNLFSQIADIAYTNNESLRFYWVGSGPKNNLYFSPYVTWLGELSSPLEIVRQCDVFLLTSIDDPFPLACLEALTIYKRCVVYENTGTAEVIKGVSGFDIYSNYTASDALKSIEKVLKENIDFKRIEEINNNISSIESFSNRLDNLMSNI
jgi:glycosyltransferase involved in cell wall biosynthesis